MTRDPLAPWRQDPAGAGVFLDFDGTLSPIVSRPGDARPLPGVPELLSRLARRLAVVAVVSGRSAAQLVRWLGPEVEIWGTHGAERARGGEVELVPAVRAYEPVMQRVLRRARAEVRALAIPGIEVEDKRVVIGLHYRAAEDRARAEQAVGDLARRLCEEHGLVGSASKMALELRPPVELSKSAVVLRRAREAGLRAALYAGDDAVDLGAFDALDRLAEDGVSTCRVAVSSDEAPSELVARADIVVDAPEAVVGLLEELT